MGFSPEQMKKAVGARSPAELLELAEAEGERLDPEQAKVLFSRLHPPVGELSDRELEDVSGGGCGQSGVEEAVPVVNDHVMPRKSRSNLKSEPFENCGSLPYNPYVSGRRNCGSTYLILDSIVGTVCTCHCPACHKPYEVNNPRLLVKVD